MLGLKHSVMGQRQKVVVDMNLHPSAVLQRIAYLKVNLNPNSEVEVLVDNKVIRCGSKGLLILEVFAQPTVVSEGLANLKNHVKDAKGWMELTATLWKFYQEGVLQAYAPNKSSPDHNPYARPTKEERGQLILNPTLDSWFGYMVKTRSAEPKTGRITIRDQPEVFRWLVDLIRSGDRASVIQEAPESVIQELVELGVLIRRQEEPDTVLFQCSLDETARETAPYKDRFRAPRSTEFHKYIVNSRINIQSSDDSVNELEHKVPYRERFSSNQPVIWVEDPGTRVRAPYWPSEDCMESINRLVAGGGSPSELRPEVFETLARANIIIHKDYDASCAERWHRTSATLRNDLHSKQYAVLRQIIHPLQIGALRSYFRTLEQKGFLYRETINGKTTRRAMHNEPVARFVHHQISYLINQISPESVKPSYCYLAIYRSGEFLPRHKDREQCAWNVSLLIDTEPEMDLSESWPIYLKVRNDSIKVQLEMGDGVMYRGTEISHWRDPIPEGHMATLIFCHFVPVDFKGSVY